MKTNYQNHRFRGLGFGLLLIFTGLVFMGLNFGLIPMELKSVIFSIPALIILIGIINLFKRNFITGFIFILIGKFFIIPKIIEVYPNAFPGIDANFPHVYWPIFLILAGLILILNRVFFPNYHRNRCKQKWNNHSEKFNQHIHRNHHGSRWEMNAEGKWESNGTGFSKNAVFGSGEHIVLDPEFKGGELNAVFGGIVLDLRKTKLPEGETRLDINAVFGGITIYVPADWYLETHINSVFGGYQDNRTPVEPQDTSRKLIITGECVFGGGEIKC
jgi:predicted membrane protein